MVEVSAEDMVLKWIECALVVDMTKNHIQGLLNNILSKWDLISAQAPRHLS